MEQQADPWHDPLPLDEAPDPPAFPTEALPHVLRDFVEAVAEDTQAPRDLPAILALGAVATACARTARIEGKPGWTEPVNLYCCVALPSGSRKSAVVAACAGPIEDHEAEEYERLRPEIAARAAERATLEARVKTLTEKAAKCAPADRLTLEADRNEAVRELELCPEMHPPRLLCNDATPEVLGRIMAEQKGRIACLSAEGAILFDHAGGRYSERGAKLDIYLGAHPGDTMRVDRVGRERDHARHPALTLCLSVQPNVLHAAMADKNFKGRGLLARFMWSVPKPTIGHRRLATEPVPDAVKARYADCLRRMLRRVPCDDPPVLRLSPDAAQAFLDIRERNERDLRKGERFEFLGDWGSKFPGLVLRVAALMHLCEHTDAELVERNTIEAALTIGEYAEQHALLAFTMMGADPARAKAESLLAWIQRNDLHEVSTRDMMRAHRALFPQAADLGGPVEVLLEAGHLREVPTDRDAPGRPPRRFSVNPRTHGHSGHKGQNTNPTPETPDCVACVPIVPKSQDEEEPGQCPDAIATWETF